MRQHKFVGQTEVRIHTRFLHDIETLLDNWNIFVVCLDRSNGIVNFNVGVPVLRKLHIVGRPGKGNIFILKCCE